MRARSPKHARERYVGQRFNHLTVIKLLGEKRDKCLCLCDICGKEKEFWLQNIVRSITKSCCGKHEKKIPGKCRGNAAWQALSNKERDAE